MIDPFIYRNMHNDMTRKQNIAKVNADPIDIIIAVAVVITGIVVWTEGVVTDEGVDVELSIVASDEKLSEGIDDTWYAPVNNTLKY